MTNDNVATNPTRSHETDQIGRALYGELNATLNRTALAVNEIHNVCSLEGMDIGGRAESGDIRARAAVVRAMTGRIRDLVAQLEGEASRLEMLGWIAGGVCDLERFDRHPEG
ncbi:MAG: hypothetical protein RIF41_41045 [Polyangiaceae bacterium]